MATIKGGGAFVPILIIFLVTNALLILAPTLEFLWNMDRYVMLAGNTILFVSTFISFRLYTRALANDNVHAFMRMIYGGMFAKMMIVLVAAMAYIFAVKKGVSKGAVFGCMFLYFVYTFVEISIIMKLSRKQKYVKE
nr:EPS_sugtrans: exopolysaccharide biosynthesis polyprenyl [uncultured bacterium]